MIHILVKPLAMMYCFTMLVILIAFHSFISVFGEKHKKQKSEFGPYYVSTKSMVSCNSSSMPADTDKNAVNVSIKILKLSKTEEDIIGEYTFPEDLQVDRAFFAANKESSGFSSPMFKRVVNNPCKNLFTLSVLKVFNVTSKCMIKKGIYKTKGVNPNSVTHKIIQTAQYDSYTFRMEMYTKNGTFYCIFAECEVNPL